VGRSHPPKPFAATFGKPIRRFGALLIGAALAGALISLVAGAAFASPTPNPPPPTTPNPRPPTTPNPPPPTTPNPPPPTTPPATARCSGARLRLKFIDMQAATGHRYIDYALKNVGARDCSLRGYLGAVLLTKSGGLLRGSRARVTRDPVSPLRTVVIEPGKRAFFTFTWVDGGFCPGNAFTFYAVRVLPPQDVRGFVGRLGRTPACGRSARVSAVRPKLFSF
jgi:hypothetical protein